MATRERGYEREREQYSGRRGRDDRGERGYRGEHGGGRGGGGRGGGRGGRGGRREEEELPSDAAVFVNYFTLDLDPTCITKYGIDFVGLEGKRTKIRPIIMRQLLRDLFGAQFAEKEKNFIFDGTALYGGSSCPLPMKEGEERKVRLRTKDFIVRLTSARPSDEPQTFNVIFTRAMQTFLLKMGRNYFLRDPEEARDVGLQIYRGYATEVAQKMINGQFQFVILIDAASKPQQTALDLIMRIKGRDQWDEHSMRQARKELQGKTVTTVYNERTYKIEDIDFRKTPHDKFTPHGEKEPISFFDYYKKKGIKLRDMNQPLLVSSTKDGGKIYLMPETCVFSDIDPRSKKHLPKLCSIKPSDFVRHIKELPTLLKATESQKILDNFKMKVVSISPLQVPHKIFPPPTLYMPGVKEFQPKSNWGPMTGRELNWNHTNPETLEVAVTYEGDQWRRTAEDYINAIAKSIDSMRAPIRFGRISYYHTNGDNYSEILSKLNPKSFVISFIPPPPDGQASYRKIKEICTKRGMRTQAIKLQRKTENFNAIVSNIAKQIINKCGHLCWWAVMPRVSKEFEGKNIMMIGIDVYHGRLERGKQPRSIGGFVAMMVNSNGNYLTAWHVSAYQARKEILGEQARPTGVAKSGELLEGPTITQQKTLTNFIQQACRVHNFNPHYIFVYRDGVGDSQMQAVIQFEVPQVREACPQARLTYIIVQKRIHTRFVIGAGDNYRNPPRGTLIDSILTRTSLSTNVAPHDEFYLITTENRMGTVKPVRYIVIENDNKVDQKLPLADIQNLTFTLCYLYPNWSDSIKLPAPTQLAHKLAYLVGESKMETPEYHRDIFPLYYYL